MSDINSRQSAFENLISRQDALEKAIINAYNEGYATGWADALQMAADLLGRIAKQRKYADANRWTNSRGEE